MKLPPAYTVLSAGSVRAAMRADLVPLLSPWLLTRPLALPAASEAVAGGRAGTHRVTLADGRTVRVRAYRRGGLIGRFVHHAYLGFSPRPLHELVVTGEARRRGVATAEVLAARVEGHVVYRGTLVTAEIPAAETLLDALRHASDATTRCTLAAAAGRAIAALHAAGVVHADLNATNIVVHPEHGTYAITLLDFDRARVRSGPLGAAARRRGLRRLTRSLTKLDPAGTLVGPAERRAFGVAYGEPGCGC